ncbi:metal ABC transporter substrate-binding protein [Vibrio hangzhouensis]|uniref:High-affinity zinc uptake system protein ZnuA n=1 Tax=Vibrio hangzhouensis TaxID=462991 RepID=A0A1H5TP16_9VIBR|nr:metal ABC transporter substrate-binding protein [Vibrio hangzhouensis]SEF63767.1 zinc transport system substrate-binding protein [Vibrio hangzhouensis]
MSQSVSGYFSFNAKILLLFSVVFSLTSNAEPSKFTVYTVNYPLKYFAQRIGGKHIKVVFPVPENEDPAFWQPDSEQLVAFQQADMILLNGAKYAKWVEKVSLPMHRQVITSDPFSNQYIQTNSKTKHSHGNGKEHSHVGIAFTTWLDLSQSIVQAEQIHLALKNALPNHTKDFDAAFDKLKFELNQLDTEMKQVSNRIGNKNLIASHPVYQYMARRYELIITPVIWEADIYPSDRQWRELDLLVSKRSAKWMIWESEPLDDSVATLKHRGVNSIVFAPLGNLPEQGDFLTQMRINIQQLQKIVE